MSMDADVKKLGGLAIGLLTLMIIVGAVFLVGAKWKESICEADGVQVYTGGECTVSSTNTTAVTVTALTQIGIVETAIVTALSFLGIVVIVGIAKVILAMAKGM